MKRIATGIAAGFGAKAEVIFRRNYPATINDEEATSHPVRAAATVSGEARVLPMERPTMGAEDFSYMLNAKQGSYIMLGTGSGPNDRACITRSTISTTRCCRSALPTGQRSPSSY